MAPLFNFFQHEQSADYSNQADDTKVMILNEGYRATPDTSGRNRNRNKAWAEIARLVTVVRLSVRLSRYF